MKNIKKKITFTSATITKLVRDDSGETRTKTITTNRIGKLTAKQFENSMKKDNIAGVVDKIEHYERVYSMDIRTFIANAQDITPETTEGNTNE